MKVARVTRLRENKTEIKAAQKEMRRRNRLEGSLDLDRLRCAIRR
jgi:hypothetical protein